MDNASTPKTKDLSLKSKSSNLQLIPIAELRPSPWQGRFVESSEPASKFDDKRMKELQYSIGEKGLMTPVVVRVVEGLEGYEIVDGHRRVEVCKALGMNEIECVVREYSDEEAQIFSVVGNLQRKNLNTIEKAMAFQKVMTAGLFTDKKAFSKAIGKDETYVGDIMNLLLMDQRIIDDLAENHTVEDVRLLRLIRRREPAKDNQSDRQWELYQKVLKEKLTRKDLEKLLKGKKSSSPDGYRIQFKKKRILIELDEAWSEDRREALRAFLAGR